MEVLPMWMTHSLWMTHSFVIVSSLGESVTFTLILFCRSINVLFADFLFDLLKSVSKRYTRGFFFNNYFRTIEG